MGFSLAIVIDQCTLHLQNNPTNVNYLEGLLGVILNIDVGGLLGLECSLISMSGDQDCKGTKLCCWVGNFVSRSLLRKKTES